LSEVLENAVSCSFGEKFVTFVTSNGHSRPLQPHDHRCDSVPPSQGFTRARDETLVPSHRAPCASNLKESFLINPFRQAELNEPEECFRMELNQVFLNLFMC
jgi:hypothetical protein